MRVLSIDLDYISTDYARFLDNNQFSVYLKERWDGLFQNSPLIPADFIVDSANFIFLFDIFTKALPYCKNVVFGQEHDSILYELENATDKIELINIDQHHDIVYTWDQIKRCQNYNVIGEGSWVWYLQMNQMIDSYLWIKTQTSEDYNIDNQSPEDPPSRYLPDLEFNFQSVLRNQIDKFESYEFDLIYISMSPQYVAPQHWFYGDILVTSYKNYYQSMPKFILEKYMWDFSKHNQVEDLDLSRCTTLNKNDVVH